MNVMTKVPKGKQRGNVLFPYKFIQSIKPFVFLNNPLVSCRTNVIMWVGNVFSHVCLCVCLSICLSVCMPVQAITFEPIHIETSFLVYRYIFTISRSSLIIKVIGSRSFEQNVKFYLFQCVNPLYIATNHY